MAQQIINVGTTANDGTGDTLRLSQQKANDNFTELYVLVDALGGGSVTPLYLIPKMIRKGFGNTNISIVEIGDLFEFGIDATTYCTLAKWNGTTYDKITTIEF
jgi:hypothetical protein